MNEAKAILRRLRRDESGGTAVEFALIALPLFAVTLGVVEAGVAWWRWTMAQKAVLAAARYAVETRPVASAFSTFDAIASLDIYPGQQLDLETIPPFAVRCDYYGCLCVSGDCAVLGTNTGFDGVALSKIYEEALRFYPALDTYGFSVEYAHVGLGFAGRPGPDIVPMVTVRLQGMHYEVMALEVFGLPPVIPMPDFAATLTGEDLDGI